MTALEKLLVPWITATERPHPGAVPHMHLRLWQAVAATAAHIHSIDLLWTPTEDPRIKWAVQYLDSLSNPKAKICPHLRATTEFLLNAHLPATHCPTSPQHLAANDR